MCYGDERFAEDFHGYLMCKDGYGNPDFFVYEGNERIYCGWNLHHILPKALGGTNAISNLIFWSGNKGRGTNEGALAFVKRMNYYLSKEYQGLMLIAEDSSDFPKVTALTIDGGLGFDYKWDLGWMNDTLSYYKLDPIYRKWHHNKINFSMAYFYSEKYLTMCLHL